MAVTLETLIDEVYTITNRPDLAAETKYAVISATIKAHNTDEFIPDIVQVVTSPTYDADLDLYQIQLAEAPFVRLRKVLAVNTYPVQAPLQVVEATNLFNTHGYLAQGIYYIAGQVLNIRDTRASQAFVTYLTRPDTADATYSSWIADTATDAIVYGAASIVFDLLGKADEKSRFSNLFVATMQDVVANNIVGR